MNDVGIRSIQGALGTAEDNLHRARMQQDADARWLSGNGESIATLVSAYERQRDDLKVALEQAKAS